VSVSVTLGHTAVVDHEEVDLEVVCAGPPDVVVLGADEVDHFDTAAVTLPGPGHGTLGVCPVPGVVTTRVFPGVALEAVDSVPGQAVSASGRGGVDQAEEQS